MRKYILFAVLGLTCFAGCSISDSNQPSHAPSVQNDADYYEGLALQQRDIICDELYAADVYSAYDFSFVEAEYWYNFGQAFESTSHGIPFGPEVREGVERVIASCF